MMNKSIRNYYSDWEGWSCNVDDCMEVIENTRKELELHLKDKHGIDVRLNYE